MSLKACSTLLLAAAIAVAAARVAPVASANELRVPGRENAYASMAASRRLVAVAWGASTTNAATDIFLSVSLDEGRTFGRPVRVNDDSSPASLSGEQPPSVTLVPPGSQHPSIVVVWPGKTASGTRLFSARSHDAGLSFTAATVVPGTDAAGNRGWQAAATGANGRVMAVWLDHRELVMGQDAATPAAGGSAHEHGAHPPAADGATRAQLSKLVFARLDDDTGARAVTGGVCYCCKTALTTGLDGSVYAAWRHVFPGNVRDIAVVVSKDGGNTFSPATRVSEDAWVLDGCPENGPAMTVDTRQRIHVVWPTLLPGAGADGEPGLAMFHASSDDGLAFRARQRLPTDGVPRHVQAVSGPGGVLWAAWDEGSSGTRRVALGRGTPDSSGRMTWNRRIVSGADTATYPVLASIEGGVIAAWTREPDPHRRFMSSGSGSRPDDFCRGMLRNYPPGGTTL